MDLPLQRVVSLVRECSGYSEKDSASLGGGEQTPAAGRVAGRAHRGHADSRQGGVQQLQLPHSGKSAA